MVKIFIDAGHGGHDPGAVGKHSKEKDNVLKVANRLKVLLENQGHRVKMSRSTDVFLTLSERARLANVWGANYFVSLHNNAATASATGFESFIYNGPVQSKTTGFQKAIHAAIIKGVDIRDRGKKHANFAVLRETRMPSVLIEYAFISNVNDEQILINEVEKLAQLTANGIVIYAGSSKLTTPNPPPKEETKLYRPTSQAITNATATVLRRLEQKKDSPLSPQWREKLLNGTLTESDAIGLLFVAIERGHIVGE